MCLGRQVGEGAGGVGSGCFLLDKVGGVDSKVAPTSRWQMDSVELLSFFPMEGALEGELEKAQAALELWFSFGQGRWGGQRGRPLADDRWRKNHVQWRVPHKNEFK